VQKLTASDGAANSNFGSAVALNGSTALIGADGSTVGGNTYQGKAYLFMESGGNWSQSDTFIASDGAVDDYFGAALAWDGVTALISTPHPTIGGNSYQGAAYSTNSREHQGLVQLRGRARPRILARPCKDHCGINLISDALPFGRLRYGGLKAAANAVGYAKFFSRSRDAVIRVYDEAENVIHTYEHNGNFKEP
jgi:hypothetical protein